MSETEIKRARKIASEFSRGLFAGASGCCGRKDSIDMCFVVAAPLSGLLSAMKISNRLVEGHVGSGQQGLIHHWWIELSDGIIIDPTADQFAEIPSRILPRVFVGKKPSWYRKL